jgi:DNA-binding response OmpR family regulator
LSLTNILVVEDNSITAQALKHDLNMAGYDVLLATSAVTALNYVKSHSFDLMITDINLGDSLINGIDLVETLNQIKNTPVIFVTAYGDDELLENIAMTDHSYYLSKPYDTDELLKVVKLTLYKYNLRNEIKATLSNNTIYDVNNKLLYEGDKEIRLTTNESLLITLLSNRKNQIVGNDDIAKFVWGDEHISPSAIRQLISRIREKLSYISIETHHGLGYRIKT